MSVRPNFQSHELHVEAGRMNSPQEPCVRLTTRELDGHATHSDDLTPDQAREYARELIAAADKAEGK